MQLLSQQSLCDLYSLLWFLNTSTMQYYHLQLIAKYLGGKKFHKRIAYSVCKNESVSRMENNLLHKQTG